MLNTLIIIYSLSGSVSRIANIIKEETGGDIFNVTSLTDYSGVGGFFRACYHQVAGVIPDVKEIPNVDKYDVIYIGAPVWAWKPAGPILKVVNNIDFNQKKVITFLTHERYIDGAVDKFKAAIKNATYAGNGLFKKAFNYNDDQLRDQVKSWLNDYKTPETPSNKEL